MDQQSLNQGNVTVKQMGKTRWILACIGFYMTAFLYGAASNQQ
jgi:hypothetical protein